MNKLDEKFIENMKKLLVEEYGAYEKSLTENHKSGLRINKLKTNYEDLKKYIEVGENVKWCNTGYYYDDDTRPAKNPLYNAGLYYIQEPSAMLTVSCVDIKEGEYILDLCAAPGGKSTHIGEKLKGSGLLVANDISNGRAKVLAKNIEKHGIINFAVINEPHNKLVNKFDGFFDKIFIDAPCSGEGMFRKEPHVIQSWNENSPKEFSEIQTDILNTVVSMLKSGGTIIYSTCTFNLEENEKVIQKFLKEHSEFELIQIDHEKLGVSKGYKLDDETNTDKAARILPCRQDGEGHFVAVLKNKGEKADNKVYSKVDDRKKFKEVYEFFEKNTNIDFDNMGLRLMLHGTSVFAVPYALYDMKGIRVVRSGMHVGELKNGKFEPSTVLALATKKENYKNIIDCKIDDIRVSKYLKGETIEADCDDGFVVVCVEGYNLGFGKSNRGKVKNKYNKAWINTEN